MSSYANTPVCIFVQERLPEIRLAWPIPPRLPYINLRV